MTKEQAIILAKQALISESVKEELVGHDKAARNLMQAAGIIEKF